MSATLGSGTRADHWLYRVALTLVVGLGVWWRMPVTTEWPMPFHRTVQYESALCARWMWLAVRPQPLTPEEASWLESTRGKYFVAPPILPGLTALVYVVLGGEQPFVSGVIASLFWLLGGWFVFDLACKVTPGRVGAMTALAFYCLAPFGIVVSQSFQTEAVMVCAFCVGLWCLVRVGGVATWRSTVAAGVACGLASLLKPGAITLPLLGAAAGISVSVVGWRRAFLTPRLVCLVFLTLLPSLLYASLFLRDHVGAKVVPQLLLTPEFYRGWASRALFVVGWWALPIGVIGALLMLRRGKTGLGIGLLFGYLAYTAVFTWHSMTHDYYQVLLIPIIAICLAPVAQAVTAAMRLERVAPAGRWVAVAATLVAGGFLASTSTVMTRVRTPEMIARYQDVSEVVPHGSHVLALSDDDGYPLTYHAWIYVEPWPNQLDKTAEKLRTGSNRSNDDRLREMLTRELKSYFVVTDLVEFHKQSDLRRILYDRYRVEHSSDRVVVFDLNADPQRNPTPF